jgi:hypothetical protein
LHEGGPFDGIGRRGIDIAYIIPRVLVVVILVRVVYGLTSTSGQQDHQSGGEDHEP